MAVNVVIHNVAFGNEYRYEYIDEIDVEVNIINKIN